MKRMGWLCLLLLSAQVVVGQGRAFFNKGTVKLDTTVASDNRTKGINERIPIRLVNNLPLVEVTIAGETYIFMFDTGAPTVISEAIYKRLGLEPAHKGKVSDSQNNKAKQVFTLLPEMKVGSLVFSEVGAVVLDLHKSVFGCFAIDGILGANQMATLAWKVNYSEKSLQATDDMRNFDLSAYTTVLPFETSLQKTPKVKSSLLGKKVNFTFDTGFTGRFKVEKKFFDADKVNTYVETYGATAVGAYGTSKADVGHLFISDDLMLDKNRFDGERVSTGNSNLIGNDFLVNFSYIMDWKTQKIYLKRLTTSAAELKTFGFDYLFVENKPTVVSVYKDQEAVQLGDVILSINEVDMQHLTDEEACHYLLNRLGKDDDVLQVKLKRKEDILELSLPKKVYFN